MSRDTQALAFLRRHPVLTWAAAWALTAAGIWSSGVFNSPRTGPLWLAFVPGVLAWAVAGAASFPFVRYREGLGIWAVAYVLAFLASGAVMAARLNFGVFVALGAFAAAAWLGAVVSTIVTDAKARPLTWIVVPGAWGGGFLIGGWVGLVTSMIGGDLVENAIGLSESGRVELTIGWGLGGAVGGALAALPGVVVRSLLARLQPVRPA